MDYNAYALRRDAATVSKFITRMVKHREDLALHTLHPQTHKFPSPPSKNSKWPAYEAAGRIVAQLDLDIYVDSVPTMAIVLSKALEAVL